MKMVAEQLLPLVNLKDVVEYYYVGVGNSLILTL